MLAVLFQLGVFSGGNFTPKAQAGSCQVSRTAAGASLEGQCNGMLPEFVASFSNACGFSCLTMTTNSITTAGTITLWFNIIGTSGSPDQRLIDGFNSIGCCTWRLDTNPSSYILVDPGCHCDIFYSTPPTLNTWYFVGISAQNSGANLLYTLDVNGQSVSSGTDSNENIQPITYFQTYFVYGDIADIQIYNTSLSGPEMTALYQEGIGGAPIRPQNIVGWWPLNGNLNDYSGNNNAAQIGTGMAYSSSWERSYTAP